MASLRALKLSSRSPRRRSRVLLLMLSFEATVSIWTAAAGQALDDQRTHVVDDVLLLRRRSEDLPAGHLQDLEQLVVRADDGHPHRLGRKDDGIPVRPEADRAPQVGLVVDPGIGPGVHEFRPDGREAPARHVAAGANDEGGEILGILPQPAQGRIALAEAQFHMRAALLDLEFFTVSDHEKVSLEVAAPHREASPNSASRSPGCRCR